MFLMCVVESRYENDLAPPRVCGHQGASKRQGPPTQMCASERWQKRNPPEYTCTLIHTSTVMIAWRSKLAGLHVFGLQGKMRIPGGRPHKTGEGQHAGSGLKPPSTEVMLTEPLRRPAGNQDRHDSHADVCKTQRYKLKDIMLKKYHAFVSPRLCTSVSSLFFILQKKRYCCFRASSQVRRS